MTEVLGKVERGEVKPEKKEQKQEVLWHTHVPIFDAKKIPDIEQKLDIFPLRFIESPSPELIRAYAEHGPLTEENFLALLTYRVPFSELKRFPILCVRQYIERIHPSILSAKDFFIYFAEDPALWEIIPDKILEKILFSGAINARELASRLLERGEYGQLLSHHACFPKESIDMVLLGKELVKRGNYELLAKNFEKFPNPPLDAADLYKKMVSVQLFEAILENIRIFPKEVINHHFLFESLFIRGEGVCIFKHLHEISLTQYQLWRLFEYGLSTEYIWQIVFDHIQYIPNSFDVTEIALDFIDKNSEVYIFENLDTFFEKGLDIQRFVERILQKRGVAPIIQHLNRFPLGGIDIERIVQIALQSRQYLQLLRFYHNFPSESFDIHDVIKNLSYRDVIYNFTHLPPGSVDLKNIANTLIHLEDVDLIINNFSLFVGIDFEKERLIPLLIADKAYRAILQKRAIFPNFLQYVPVIIDELIREKKYELLSRYGADLLLASETPQVHAPLILRALFAGTASSLVIDFASFFEATERVGCAVDFLSEKGKRYIIKNVSINELLMQERYVVPVMIARWKKELKIKTDHQISSEGLRESHALLIRDGRVGQAKYLAMYLKECGKDLEIAQNNEGTGAYKVYEDVQNIERDIERRVREKEFIFPHREVIALCVYSSVEKILFTIDGSGRRLSFTQKRIYESLMGSIERKKPDMIAWLRWYVLYAVFSELQFQFDRGVVFFGQHTQSMINQSSYEDVLNFFASASVRFRHPNAFPRRDYGGDAWAKVADTAYALWASEHPPTFLIDLVLQLEHNGGALFDRDVHILAFDHNFMQKALDETFRVTDMRSYLAAFSDEMLPAQEREELSDMLWEAERLKQSLSL